MKKNKILLVVLLLVLLVIPSVTLAKEIKYNTLDFEKTLQEEELEKKYEKYSPDKDAITIYLFRGKGCTYCRAFLDFMNSITNEYGKYFKMESYEVWNDSNNSQYMTAISNFLGKPASGVPYIIIGDQVFPGFNAEAYGEGIKNAIKTLYDTKKSDRYDVMEEYKKSLEEDNKSGSNGSDTLIVCLVVVVCAVIGIAFTNSKFTQLEEKMDDNKKLLKESKSNDYVSNDFSNRQKTKPAKKTKKEL